MVGTGKGITASKQGQIHGSIRGSDAVSKYFRQKLQQRDGTTDGPTGLKCRKFIPCLFVDRFDPTLRCVISGDVNHVVVTSGYIFEVMIYLLKETLIGTLRRLQPLLWSL